MPPQPTVCRTLWALLIGANESSTQRHVSCRQSLKALLVQPNACSLPGAVLASDPARCDLGKSIKETDSKERLKTNKAKPFLMEPDGDPRESGRVNKNQVNKAFFS